ncbi:hypothetical protein TWF694_007786 [Orbilia ellipsospora]|uniref:Uncharacterized protein n=1 Tax=Orbilia ellipsospora TaxID=2528407 RepID=A0AAV9XIR4_9PEZI
MKTSIIISVFALVAGIIATPVLDAAIPKEVPRDLKGIEVRDAISERSLDLEKRTGECGCGQCVNGKTCCTICSLGCGGECVLWCGLACT